MRESVIVLMGTLAKFATQDEQRIATTITRLVDALRTPSELVQKAVAKCLVQLLPCVRAQAPALIARLLKTVQGMFVKK